MVKFLTSLNIILAVANGWWYGYNHLIVNLVMAIVCMSAAIMLIWSNDETSN